MKYYFDTSALCRYYHAEPGSDKVQALIDDSSTLCILSYLTVLETYSAFASKARTKSISAAKLRKLRTKFKTDVARHKFKVVRDLRRHYEQAAALIERYGQRQRLRSLDALHLAIALDLHHDDPIDGLVTTDKCLQSVATAEGLPVINPLAP